METPLVSVCLAGISFVIDEHVYNPHNNEADLQYVSCIRLTIFLTFFHRPNYYSPVYQPVDAVTNILFSSGTTGRIT